LQNLLCLPQHSEVALWRASHRRFPEETLAAADALGERIRRPLPPPSLSLSSLLSPFHCFSPRARLQLPPLPPLCATDTGFPSPSEHGWMLCLAALFLPIKGIDAGWPKSSPVSPSSPQVPELRRLDSPFPDLPCRRRALLRAQGEPPHPAPAFLPRKPCSAAGAGRPAGEPCGQVGIFPCPARTDVALGLLGQRGG
jgi:hypothetical protein